MNYIEWALQRGAELWRAREEALKKRLSLVPEGTAQKKAAEAQLSEEEAAAQDAEMSGGAETVAEAADDPVETAAVRLGQKLGLGATQEDDGSERETAFSAEKGFPRRMALSTRRPCQRMTAVQQPQNHRKTVSITARASCHTRELSHSSS